MFLMSFYIQFMLREGFTSCGYVGKEDGMKIPSSFFLPPGAGEGAASRKFFTTPCFARRCKTHLNVAVQMCLVKSCLTAFSKKLPGSNWFW